MMERFDLNCLAHLLSFAGGKKMFKANNKANRKTAYLSKEENLFKPLLTL